MKQVKVQLFSHSVRLTPLNDLAKKVILHFCGTLIQYKTERVVEEGQPVWKGKLVQVPDCTYAASPQDRSYYSFHIEQYPEIRQRLIDAGISESDMEVAELPIYTPKAAKLKLNPKWSIRDYQEPVIEFMVEPGQRKILPVQTGKGKTFMSLAAAARIGQRLVIVTRGGYIKKWVGDVKDTYDIDPDRILVLQGGKDIMRAIDYAKTKDLDADVILITTDTLSAYIKAWEAAKGTPAQELYIDPVALWYLLGVGVRIIDEAHQMLHAYFKIDLYTHIPKAIYLSATIIGNNDFETKIHNIIYPKKYQYTSLEWDKYIVATSLYYNLSAPDKARYKDFRKNYSHVVFEQYLMRNRKVMHNYLQMIDKYITAKFINSYKKGQKYMVFASTVELCTIVTEHLARKYPHLRVGRYVGEDDLDVTKESDIIVSTPGSGGTAIDIPNLVGVLCTCAISSRKLNIQMLGRLRKIKDFTYLDPEYTWLVCMDIPKQIKYDQDKVELFADLVKTHRKQMSHATI